MKSYIKSCILFLAVLSSIFINKSFAQSKDVQSDWKAFIPKGFDTLTTYNVDLNKDRQQDKVLVLYDKKENDKDNFDEIDRKLIILFKEGNIWRKVAETDNAVLCKKCGGVFGDPFEGISIENNSLIIMHYGGSSWRWAYTHRFRYQNNNFYLIGQTSHSFWNVEMCEKLDDFLATEYKDENFITGRYEYRKMDDKKCKWLKNEKGKHAVKPLQKLTDFTF
ncbi:MAG: hypothetical protein WBP45_04435 [Daejeonella sp.]